MIKSTADEKTLAKAKCTLKPLTRPCKDNPHQFEYFLITPKYNGWYSARKIEEFDECPVNHINVRKRFNLIGTRYKTMWDAIITPKTERGQYGVIKENKMKAAIDDWALLNSLMR